jgi:hypothetical protein
MARILIIAMLAIMVFSATAHARTCVWVQLRNGNTINSDRWSSKTQCLAQSKNKIACGQAECRPRDDPRDR